MGNSVAEPLTSDLITALKSFSITEQGKEYQLVTVDRSVRVSPIDDSIGVGGDAIVSE